MPAVVHIPARAQLLVRRSGEVGPGLLRELEERRVHVHREGLVASAVELLRRVRERRSLREVLLAHRSAELGLVQGGRRQIDELHALRDHGVQALVALRRSVQIVQALEILTGPEKRIGLLPTDGEELSLQRRPGN